MVTGDDTRSLGFSRFVTRNGSPDGFPVAGSKRRPHTFRNPDRFDTKYSVCPSGDQRGLSSQNVPSETAVHWPPSAETT